MLELLKNKRIKGEPLTFEEQELLDKLDTK